MPDGSLLHRTPAVAAGLADAPLSVANIVCTQMVGFVPPREPTREWFGRGHDGGAPRSQDATRVDAKGESGNT